MVSLAVSQGCLKGDRVLVSRNSVARSCLPALAPLRTVLDNPIGEGSLKADVLARLFRFNPLVLQNLLAFRLKLPVERRIFQQIVCRWWLFRFVRHNRELKTLRLNCIGSSLPDSNVNL